jgi:hypothetical protein
MQDPPPENITGSKQHVFEHTVNWSHLAIAVAVIYVTWKFSRFVGSGSGDESGTRNTQEDDAAHLGVMST